MRRRGFQETEFHADIEVLRLQVVQPTIHVESVTFIVAGASPVELDGREGKASPAGSLDEDLEDWLKPSPHEEDSLCSEADTEAEEMQDEAVHEAEAEISDDGGKEEEGDRVLGGARAPTGTWVIFRSLGVSKLAF